MVLALWIAFMLPLLAPTADGSVLPKTIRSAACRVAPTIDGVADEAEWNAASPIAFELKMFRLNPLGASTRDCQLRVMNSANALYVALRMPDSTLNNSLSPLVIDFALLAFCRGERLVPGDDRKAVGPGLYLDKHVVESGKDADDPRQDGRGALGHEQGIYTVEWAIPLDSGDPQDIQARPGQSLRFNLAYFDAFQADMKGTEVGVGYGTSLDRADEWGSIQLAAEVEDDGGTAFRGPAWAEGLFQTFPQRPAGRLRLVDSALLPGEAEPALKMSLEYDYLDRHGESKGATAKLYLPGTVKDKEARVPLYYSAGYELDDAGAMKHVRRGFAVATPSRLEANPLVRTANPDIALLHIARSLPMVDDARVIIGGGSAGGYMTLMLAAETFPLAGAAPDVPPVNWGYNAAYFLQRESHGKVEGEAEKRTPVFDVIVPIARQAAEVYGANTDAIAWFNHSPLAHLDTITCPVSVYFSTADMLVPIDQVGSKWIRAFDPSAFPDGFTMDRQKLTTTAEGRRQLAEVLGEDAFELFLLEEATLQRYATEQKEKGILPELPFSRSRQWSVTVLDEGPPEPQLGHVKYPVQWSRREFLDHVLTGRIAASQLTLDKLRRLIHRYAGQEWLATNLVHLDYPERERADVLRGLRTYVATGDMNARVLAGLYAQLRPAEQVLEAEIVRELIDRPLGGK